MDRDTDAVQVGGSFERRRGPSILVAIVGMLVLLALVKPWSFGAGSGRGDGGAPATPSTASASAAAGPAGPSPTSDAPDANELTCFAADREQLVLLERWPDTEVRSWIAITTVGPTSPLDPAIPTTTIHSSHLIGLGICPPSVTDGPQFCGALLLSAQRITSTPTGPTAADLGVGPLITRITGNPDLALLYGPAAFPVPAPSETVPQTPAGSGAAPARTAEPATASWSSGTYVLSFAYCLEPAPQIHWLKIEIQDGARGAG
jgi:hypothetical protein